jgi:hypothetical protein
MGKHPSAGRDLELSAIFFDILSFSEGRKSLSILIKSHRPKAVER